MRTIETRDDIAEGVRLLVAADPRLAAVLAEVGEVPLRRHEPTFNGMARVVVSQQISTHAAGAIWGRLAAHAGEPLEAAAFRACTPEALRAAGLSAAKIRTLTALAEASLAGDLDLTRLAREPHDVAIARLVTLPGIGPWTAEIFLMFCAGHPDIWPGGDIALQGALAMAFDLPARPGDKETRAIAESWAPWRSVAARLFWAFYGVRRAGRVLEPV